jgi:hypothetical protein
MASYIYPWDDVMCRQDDIFFWQISTVIPTVYSMHDYILLFIQYAMLLDNVFGHIAVVSGLDSRVFPCNFVCGVTHINGLLKLISCYQYLKLKQPIDVLSGACAKLPFRLAFTACMV